MYRYNIFKQIHKGLRTMLYETALLLQQTDYNNPEQATTSLNELAVTIDLFEKHADTEDSLVFPAIAQFEPSVVDAFEQEHITDKALGLKLEELQQVYKYASTQSDKVNTGVTINAAFIKFMVFNLEHMAKEENILNKILWRYYSDDELHGITQQIIAKTSPETMTAYSRWMIRGLSNLEISEWLKQVKYTAPEFVFQELLKIAGEELPSNRWLSIQATISEGRMIA